jgi:hypothetical protein
MSTLKFAAVLKAPDSEHRRHTAVRAVDEADARAQLAAMEAEQVAYSLSEDIGGAWQQTDGGVLVKCGLDEQSYEKVLSEYRFDDTGKVVFTGEGKGNARLRAKLAQDHQLAPYTVESLTLVDPDREKIQFLVREATKLSTRDAALWQQALEELRAAGLPTNAVTAALFGVPLKNMLGGTSVWDWDTSVIQCSLHTALTYDVDAHDYFNDVSASEVTGTNYTANGNTLTCSAPTYDTATDQVRCDASDTSWSTSTISATDAIVWNNTGGATSTDPLIAGIDFGATVSTTAGTFAITFDSTGIVVIDCT